ncbi:hypothetical protein BDV93DRAFT_47759 [Ceratobasidium sp. AG-I]|nr:hypothetical protein BDV93DRAFT_47759 [Ceratobasidium sp. AG-I]
MTLTQLHLSGRNQLPQCRGCKSRKQLSSMAVVALSQTSIILISVFSAPILSPNQHLTRRWLEIVWGLHKHAFNVNTSLNLMHLRVDWHVCFDQGLWALVPLNLPAIVGQVGGSTGTGKNSLFELFEAESTRRRACGISTRFFQATRRFYLPSRER